MAEKQEFEDQKLSDAKDSDNTPEVDESDPRKGLPANVRVEEVNAPTELALPDPLAKGPWIQYNGVGTLRYLDEAAWKEAGIDSDLYVEWNYLNHKRIPVSKFSDQQLQYLLRCDGRFSVVTDEELKEAAKN